MNKEKDSKSKLKDYNPNVGFIGTTKVDVSNYLFSSRRKRAPYHHSRPLVKNLLNRGAATHFKESKNLTRFIRKRDLTFQKTDASGNYKIFTVPCTTTIVPLQKSVFNTIERAAQTLIASLRCVIQDIYGSKSVKDSGFVKSLPLDVRKIFVEAVMNSPNYFPELHHPNMRKYPFFDNVGLDLVLVEDYLEKSKNFEKIFESKKFDKLPTELPFRILELNAGAPSGASNNMNVLEGHYEQNPEVLESMGKLLPNDHFQILAETYKSLGEDWTGIKNGIQVILPPGGMNGAAPEIHNLATYSGLVYADPVGLFQDEKGFIRLRTINGSNPIVTAIYSRINADSALFDIEKGIILRDPETNEPLYLRDSLKLGEDGKAPIIHDVNGKPIPLQSDYAIPGLLEAIINKRIYLGGLNRILDNKIILAALTTYAPKYFASRLKEMGLGLMGPRILPPETLPPRKESLSIIEKNRDEWVIKAPNLSGGSGIYIMKTLPEAQKDEVMAMARKKPTQFAYQKLVKIARIPVAIKDKKEMRFANLAADIRLWVFYGGGKSLPKMTHNALVRYAPEEKGPMSSIVNTSKGGGYAPFVVIDDIGLSESVSASEFMKPKNPVPLQTHLPMFVAAQLIQVSRLALKIYESLQSEKTADSYILMGLCLSLKTQCREILSFLDPRAIGPVYEMIDLLEKKQNSEGIGAYFDKINTNQIKLVELLEKLERKNKYPLELQDLIEELVVLDMDVVYQHYSAQERKQDLLVMKKIQQKCLALSTHDPQLQREYSQLRRILMDSVKAQLPRENLNLKATQAMMKLVESFFGIVRERLQNSEKSIEFAKIFSLEVSHPKLNFDTLNWESCVGSMEKSFMTATQKEFATGVLLTESDYIPSHLQTARKSWMKILKEASRLSAQKKKSFITKKREEHFKNFPFLERMHEIMHSKRVGIKDLLDLMPAMPYAQYNLEQFAKKQGLSLEEIFTGELTPNRISLLSSKKIQDEHLSARDDAGECFAKKRKSHGLFSESDIFIWMRKELDPLTLIYTAGHEVIHYHQIEESRKMEAKALSDGAIAQAYFLNYYGNFLGISSASLEGLSIDISVERQPLYGLADRIVPYFFTSIITEIREGINQGAEVYTKILHRYGPLLGLMMPNSYQVRVKALQEILPALENAKNILFCKELGLMLEQDEIRSALPTANSRQIKKNKARILRAIKTPRPDIEALMAIGNHQFFGVRFPRKKRLEDSIVLNPILSTISLGSSYNQTQQQQQQ